MPGPLGLPAPGRQRRPVGRRPGGEWTRLDGAFRRFPLGVRKVGRIAATGEPIEVLDLLPIRPDWVAARTGCAPRGSPGSAASRWSTAGEVLGVLAVFARGTIGPECMDWLRT